MWRDAVGSRESGVVGRSETYSLHAGETPSLQQGEPSLQPSALSSCEVENLSPRKSAASSPTTDPRHPTPWLSNHQTSYLRQYGAPQTIEAFRENIPIVSYDDLVPWIDRIVAGESDVLFAGRPIAFERTSGSSGAVKLVPYSGEGLRDFQRSVAPWFADVLKTFAITGSVYFSISPATRAQESIGGVGVGLPDGAFLGDAGAATLAQMTAVPFDVASITDVDTWRADTLRYLIAARDLELISVWSPTFLLRLLEDIDDPQRVWPRLKLVSCWTAGASKPFADELAKRLPHAHLQPKGLLSTETVVTVPDDDGRPVLTPHGFFEFARDERAYLSHELRVGDIYEVIATTASGLYRYRTADLVRYDGLNPHGRPILEFVGRGELVSDLVGEKLTDAFVASCLEEVPGFRILVPEPHMNGYTLLAETGVAIDIDDVEQRLCANPQYAYARRIGQLRPLRLAFITHLFDRFAQAQIERGVRLGDVKPVVLRNERDWLGRLGCRS
jgi:hypothetical protein